jgi:protein O-GlcNAc transferase
MVPTTVDQAFQIAQEHHQAGRSDEATRLYQQILTQRPDHTGALHNMGVLALQAGKPAAAAELFQRVIRIMPDFAAARSNLGAAFMGMGRLDDAIASFREAIRLKPDLANAHSNLGNALRDVGQIDDAIAACREAIRLKPDYAEVHGNLGNALNSKGRSAEAIAAYRQAIRLKPDLAEPHSNLGNALKDKGGNMDEVIACHRQAIRLKPVFAAAHCNLGNALKDIGYLGEAIAAYRKAVELKPGSAEAHSNLIYSLQFHPDYDARTLYEESRRWNQRFAEPARKLIQPHANDRDPNRRLRIGYVSPDFRAHVVGQNLLPLFREHDHRQMEIFCYANLTCSDALTEQFRRYSDAWRDIAGVSDSRVADLIGKDRIDILVDLTLHMEGNRLGVFARKPAPVQATFAGYPGSTGLDTIEYRLTDPHLDPPGFNADFYSERPIHLDGSFWCYDPFDPELTVNPLPAQTGEQVTFGCLNNFCKVNQQVLRLWARVLKTVDRSRMMILCREGSHRQSLMDLLKQEGIDSDRIELAAPRPRGDYFELYRHIDVGLDTFPYNGHTTSLDSFWMGVPVVTLVGKTVVGRAGLSQLTDLDLSELIAHTPEQYLEIAAGLAKDLPRLAELRRTLRARMRASPLMDAPRFARNIEAAYRQMWRNWCAQGGKSGLQCPA